MILEANPSSATDKVPRARSGRIMSRRLSILAILSLSLAQHVVNAADTPSDSGEFDPRVRITSPISGTIFAPGDTITVDISVDASIQTLLVAAGLNPRAAGMNPGVMNFADAPPFRITLVVPDNFAGKSHISVLVLDVDDKEILSAPIPILVRHASPPSRLLATNTLILDEGAARGIVVQGIFTNGLQLAVASSDLGTTYTSANPWIASVDTEGIVTGVSAGTTSIKTQNGGNSAFTVVHVKGERPAPTRSVTGQVHIERSEVRFEERKFRFQQTITISNTGVEPIPGPLLLTLDSVPAEVRWVNHGGITENVAPHGTDYTELRFANGTSLAPGESVSLVLQFDALDPAAITYTPRVSQSLWP